jgi:hypothetical protein
MARKLTTLEKMKNNPYGDWTISDVEKLCREIGLSMSTPSGGSHYVITSNFCQGHQTVPARRPIKPIYIKHLVGLCEAHIRFRQINEGE